MERIASRRFEFPAEWTPLIQQELERLGNYTLDRPVGMQTAIQRLSDFYIKHPGAPTPWKEPWAVAAYLSYFFPLNWVRAASVLEEAKQTGFLSGLTDFEELGSGPGTVALQLQEHLGRGRCVEISAEARHLHQRFSESLKSKPFELKFEKALSPARVERPRTLGVFSYVLTEVGFQILDSLDFEALLILEPSTQEVGRRLMGARGPLIQRGYHVWAPCTHQGPCPLLEGSQRDWCHDRIAPVMPEWYSAIERGLPMKNATVTFSYLLMRKQAPPHSEPHLRFVGDTLEERGKSRQLICRSPKREFLSWLHRDFKDLEFARGTTLELRDLEVEQKAAELRIKKTTKK